MSTSRMGWVQVGHRPLAHGLRADTTYAAGGRRAGLVLHSPGFSERLHRLLLLRRELVGHRDLHLNDQVATRAVLLDPLRAHAEALSRRGTRWDLDRHLRPVERLDAHA